MIDLEKIKDERRELESLLDDKNKAKELIDLDIAPDHRVKVNKQTFMKIPESDLA